jgi:hypothetical protein
MVIISAPRVRRTPAQRMARILMGAAAVWLIIYGLSLIPYDILRAERLRIYGESSTAGIVTAMRTETATDESARFFADYKYVDSDGLARQGTARLPHAAWQRLRPGSRIEVLYTRQNPGLSRIRHEIEPPFQLWLRRMLH